MENKTNVVKLKSDENIKKILVEISTLNSKNLIVLEDNLKNGLS